MSKYADSPSLYSIAAEAQKLLSSPAGQRLCATSLVIDEVRAQVAVKLGIWKAEGYLARQRLEGFEPQQELNEEAEQNKKYVLFVMEGRGSG
jgi:N-terminal acetyltransferase B complex non-catalytic subunit